MVFCGRAYASMWIFFICSVPFCVAGFPASRFVEARTFPPQKRRSYLLSLSRPSSPGEVGRFVSASCRVRQLPHWVLNSPDHIRAKFHYQALSGTLKTSIRRPKNKNRRFHTQHAQKQRLMGIRNSFSSLQKFHS